ncbi:serine hydrolase [Flavobacteriaceae bacterium M23B6Z8]
MLKKYVLLFQFVVLVTGVVAQQKEINPLLADNSLDQQAWVQAQYDSLDTEAKIGQLLAFHVKANMLTTEKKALEENLYLAPVGTVIVEPPKNWSSLASLNSLNQELAVPLLVGTDTRFSYPDRKALSAVADKELIQQVGVQVGQRSKNIGIHFNMTPSVPMRSNASGVLAVGSSAKDMEQAQLLMQGLQAGGVMSCSKHYFEKPLEETTSLDSIMSGFFSVMPPELSLLRYYTTLIEDGVSAITTSYKSVSFPSYTNDIPPELSERRLPGTLRDKIGFKGLLISDEVNAPSEALNLFLAGNDIIYVSRGLPMVYEELKKAYVSGIISEERLALSVKKILMAKYKAGLHLATSDEITPLHTYDENLQDSLLMENLAAASVTLLKNNLELVPVRNLNIKKIAFVPLGDGDFTPFLNRLKLYASVDLVKAPLLDELLDKLSSYNLVIIGMHPSEEALKRKNQFSAIEKTWLYEISRKYNVILNLFTDPAELSRLSTVTNTETILTAYTNTPVFQEKMAEVIFGAIPTRGKLPITISDQFIEGTGLPTNSLSRLSYGLPEQVGMNSRKLKKIDSVVRQAIDSMVMPGAQLLVARKGKVFYHKSFGNTRFVNGDSVTNDHIYDLASLTKILATLPMVMKLEEAGKLGLKSSLKDFYSPSLGTNKANITLLEMLTHYGRFKPWIPFYLYTLDSITGRPSPEFYSKKRISSFTTKVVGNLYLRSDYKDSIRQRILDTDLRKRKEYRYSDLPYYLLKEVIEKSYGSSLDKLTQKQLYAPLGAYHTTYNPLNKFSRTMLVPSEDDNYFRHQVIQGYVHDMGAAMQGGVGGHAGLFSNANDVAKIMQMYLWDGYYGGKRYFKTGTIDRFNRCYFCEDNVRRGVGFDKPQLEEKGPTCGCVSMKSFGHSGFTGTYTWADPEKEIVYVFLSNRTFPSASNRKLITEGTRTVIQQIIYDAIAD